jgi:hypothetical protein
MSLKDDLDNARDRVALLERVLAAYPDAAYPDAEMALSPSGVVATVPIAKCNGIRLAPENGAVFVNFGDESLGVWNKAQPVKADDLLLTILEQEGGPEMIQRALNELAAMRKR